VTNAVSTKMIHRIETCRWYNITKQGAEYCMYLDGLFFLPLLLFGGGGEHNLRWIYYLGLQKPWYDA